MDDATTDRADEGAPKPRGLLCPECQGNDLRVSGVKKPRRGLRVRYLRCVCGTRMQTEEVVKRHWRPGPDAPADK